MSPMPSIRGQHLPFGVVGLTVCGRPKMKEVQDNKEVKKKSKLQSFAHGACSSVTVRCAESGRSRPGEAFSSTKSKGVSWRPERGHCDLKDGPVPLDDSGW